jgi:hypothetical protein
MSSVCSDIDFIDQFFGIEEDDLSIAVPGLSERNKATTKPAGAYLNFKNNEDDEYEDIHNMNNDDEHFKPPPVYLSEEVQEICRVNNLPYYFKSRKQTRYLIRMSQCKITRRFTVPKSDERRYYVQCCSFPECQFNIKVHRSKLYGDIIAGGNGVHTCDTNDHFIEHFEKTTTASTCEFLAYFLKTLVRNGVVSLTKLHEHVLRELKCDVCPATILRAKNKSYDDYVFSDEKGFKLLHSYVDRINQNGGRAVLETIILDEENNNLPTSTNTINFLAEEGVPLDELLVQVPNNPVTETGIIRGELDINNTDEDYIDNIDESNITFRNNNRFIHSNNVNNIINGINNRNLNNNFYAIGNLIVNNTTVNINGNENVNANENGNDNANLVVQNSDTLNENIENKYVPKC